MVGNLRQQLWKGKYSIRGHAYVTDSIYHLWLSHYGYYIKEYYTVYVKKKFIITTKPLLYEMLKGLKKKKIKNRNSKNDSKLTVINNHT